MTTTNVTSINPFEQQSQLQTDYRSAVLKILDDAGMDRDEKIEALRNLEVKPYRTLDIVHIIRHKESLIYEPEVMKLFFAPFSEDDQVSLLNMMLSGTILEEDVFAKIYQVFKDKMPLIDWCQLSFDSGNFNAGLFLGDINEESAAQFSLGNLEYDIEVYGKEFVSKVHLFCPLPDGISENFDHYESLRQLLDHDLREVFERLLKENIIDAEKVVLYKLFVPESWHEESSFRAAWRVSNEKSILAFIEEAKNKVGAEATLSPVDIRKSLTRALLTGRLDLADQILEIFPSIDLFRLKGCVALGEIASLDWAYQKGLLERVKSALGTCVTELFGRDVSPASRKTLKEFLEKDYIDYKPHKIHILTALIQSEKLGYLEMLFDWREVTPEEWSQVFDQETDHTSALLKHIFKEGTHQEVEEFFQKIPDEQLEKILLERDIFKDMEEKFITHFAAIYLKYDFMRAVEFIVEWKTKMSKSSLFKWNSINITSLLLSFKHHPECEHLRAMSQTEEWTPEMLFSWATQIEDHWMGIRTSSICQNLLREVSSSDLPQGKTVSQVLRSLSSDVQKKIFTSPSVLRDIQGDLHLVLDLLGIESFELEFLGTRLPQNWLKKPEFLEAVKNNQLSQIQEALERDLSPQEASQWIGKALIRGHLDLAKQLAEKNPEAEPLPQEVQKFCLAFNQFESLHFIEIYQHASKAHVVDSLLFYKILSLPDQTERLRTLRLFSQSGMNFQPFMINRLQRACEEEDLEEALFLMEFGALHLDHYGSGVQGNYTERDSSFGILKEASDRMLRHIFKHAPQTWFQYLLQNPAASLAVGHDRALQIALEVHLKLQQEEAIQLMKEVDREIGGVDEKNLVINAFYRALFLSLKHPKNHKKLLQILKFFHGEKAPVLQEIFFHIFTKFRPEILSSDSKLIAFFACWSSIQNDEERALFFNGLQVQHPIKKIRDAILGRRYFHGAEDREDERAILESLAYIEVATYQKGKHFALEIYRTHFENPEVQLAAVRALTSLAVPLPQEIVQKMRNQCLAEETPMKMKEALLQLFWAMSRDPDDAHLKEMFLSEPEAALDLLGYLNYSSQEIASRSPTLLELSHRDDRKIRIRAALTLSRLSNEEALLRALEIIQSSDWEAYDEDFRVEERRHQGHWLMFLKRPTFQDSRSAMVRRILDRLAEVNRSQLRDVVTERMEAFKADPETFPRLKALFDHVMDLPSSSRYLDTPIYYPKGAIFRGLCGRKGEDRFYESLRDLFHHGSYRSDLSHLGKDYDYGTWGKIGQSFGSHSKAGISLYNERDGFVGATIAFKSHFYNHEYLKGFARHETEGSLNTLLYRGIPWAVIRRVKISQQLQEPLEALRENRELPDSRLFEGLGPEEIEDLRENLAQVYEKLTFGDDIEEEEISIESIAKKSVKRLIQREEAKKLYAKEVAMQDEILENSSDEEYGTNIERMIDLFKPGVKNDAVPQTKGLPPTLRKVVRLAFLFRGGDLSKLEEKRALHRLSYSGIELVKALIRDISYEEALQEHQFLPCSEEEYQQLIKCTKEVT